MIIYYANLIITTFLNFFSRISQKNIIKKVFPVIAVAITIFIAGFRYNVGTDFQSYVDWFNMFINLPLDFFDLNIGFNLLIKLIQLFTYNPQVLFFISAIIINSCIFLFIKDNTDLYDLGFFLFIALYFYYSSLNIMRQWIAIAICLYALKYAYDKKLCKFLLAIIIASSFHITSLIMLLIYLLMRIKLNKKNTIIVVSVIFLFVILLNTLGVTIATNIGLNQKYIDYLKFDSTLDGGGYAYLIFSIITLGIIFKNYQKYLKQNKYGEYHIKLLIITTIIALFSINSMIFNRIQLYFVPILLICIPNIINLVENKKNKNIIFIIILFIGAVYMTRCLLNNGGEPLPYVTIFN